MKYIIPICLLLAGCATVPEATAPAPKHHLALKAPPPSVAPAPVPMTVEKPSPRERGLHALRWLFGRPAQ